MTAHTQRGHAKLSPSASKRWFNCPGSVRLSEGIADKGSVYADEGTAAHELAQHCMETGFDADRFGGMHINLKGKTPAGKFLKEPAGDRCFLVTDEMAECVQIYLDYVREIAMKPGVEWQTEQWLDLSHYGIEGLDGGTGDFVAYDPELKVLDVADFKYGRGVAVDPRENSQGLCYAIGAIKRYHNRGLVKLRITVAQPRCGGAPVRTWEADVVDLLDFENELVERAKATHAADAPLAAGDWCKFCKAAPVCPALRDHALSIAQAEFSTLGEIEMPVVTAMEPAKLASVLREAEQVKDWCRRVEEYAHHEATHGRSPPGFKLVAKRAVRRWKDEAGTPEVLADIFGLSAEQVMTEPELKTPAQVEPLIPGKNKQARAAAMADLVNKESSGTVLAPDGDPRPAVRADASEFSEET